MFSLYNSTHVDGRADISAAAALAAAVLAAAVEQPCGCANTRLLHSSKEHNDSKSSLLAADQRVCVCVCVCVRVRARACGHSSQAAVKR